MPSTSAFTPPAAKWWTSTVRNGADVGQQHLYLEPTRKGEPHHAPICTDRGIVRIGYKGAPRPRCTTCRRLLIAGKVTLVEGGQ